MISIVEKANCCGCTACMNICPMECISMETDQEGFLYPIVDEKKCIQCGLCNRTCPIESSPEKNSTERAFAVQHKERDILYHSAAGGAFSALAQYMIESNGVVYGAAYDEKMCVCHEPAVNIEEIKKFRSSKYVQSSQGTCYKSVKRYLEDGKSICYSGTPCQIAGLKKFLGKDYNNLVTVDLVCKGVASPEVLKQYTELMEKKFHSKIVNMNFKRKTYGYHSSTMSVDFENGVSYSKGGITDLMMRSFRANICLRPSCTSCVFKGCERSSDLTIFDCWHYSKLTGNKDNDKGHTAVLVHTSRGLNALKDCEKYLIIDEINQNKAIELDGIMVSNTIASHPNRDMFMQKLYKNGLKNAVNACIPITIMDQIKDKSKAVLYRLGLLEYVKKFR